MLVVSCDVRDILQIGETISIQVLEVGDDHVRVGVTSPEQIPEYQEHTLYVSDALTDEQSEDVFELVGT
jgi:carbon storage regulator CsrA